MVPLARRNLLAEKGRFAMSVVGVAFAVLLVLIVVSLYRGWSDVGHFYERLPGDIWISQTGTSDPFHSTSFLPREDARRLAAVPGVAAVIPVYARHIAFAGDGREDDVFAMALEASPGLRLSSDERRYFPAPGRIDVDRVLADRQGLHVGSTLRVLGRRLVVSRIHRGGNSIFQTAFLNARDAQAMFGTDGLVNFLVLAFRPHAAESAVAAAAARALPRVEAHTSRQFASSFAGRINSGFLAVVGVLVAIGFAVGGAVVALTAYTATLERSREYGVLKAIGASAAFLYKIVLQQSLIVGVLGALLGIAGAAAATGLIRDEVPEFITVLRWSDVVGVFAVALVTSVAASYVPVQRINRIDPATVFRP